MRTTSTSPPTRVADMITDALILEQHMTKWSLDKVSSLYLPGGPILVHVIMNS